MHNAGTEGRYNGPPSKGLSDETPGFDAAERAVQLTEMVIRWWIKSATLEFGEIKKFSDLGSRMA